MDTTISALHEYIENLFDIAALKPINWDDLVKNNAQKLLDIVMSLENPGEHKTDR